MAKQGSWMAKWRQENQKLRQENERLQHLLKAKPSTLTDLLERKDYAAAMEVLQSELDELERRQSQLPSTFCDLEFQATPARMNKEYCQHVSDFYHATIEAYRHSIYLKHYELAFVLEAKGDHEAAAAHYENAALYFETITQEDSAEIMKKIHAQLSADAESGRRRALAKLQERSSKSA